MIKIIRISGGAGAPIPGRRDWVGESDVAIRDTLEHFELPDGLDEDESWHESTRSGEASYNLALPGGIRVQAPQIIPAAVPVPIRVAWMPNAQTLLRAEGVVTALEAVEGSRRAARAAAVGDVPRGLPEGIGGRSQEIHICVDPGAGE